MMMGAPQVVLLYVLVQIFAFMILGFGVAGGQLLIELANTGVTYSLMYSFWKEGVHLRAFQPGSRSFFMIMAVQFCVMYTEQLIGGGGGHFSRSARQPKGAGHILGGV